MAVRAVETTVQHRAASCWTLTRAAGRSVLPIHEVAATAGWVGAERTVMAWI